jgi:hypothetical protein
MIALRVTDANLETLLMVAEADPNVRVLVEAGRVAGVEVADGATTLRADPGDWLILGDDDEYAVRKDWSPRDGRG